MLTKDDNSNQLELTHALLFRGSDIGVFEDTDIQVSDPSPVTINDAAIWHNFDFIGGFMYHKQPEGKM